MIAQILSAMHTALNSELSQKRALNLQIEIVGKLIDRRWAVAIERDDKPMMNAIVSILHDATNAADANDLATLKNCEARLNELR